MPDDEDKAEGQEEPVEEGEQGEGDEENKEEGEDSDVDMDGGDDGAGENKEEFVERDFVPRPYNSDSIENVAEDVDQSIVKNKRPRLKMKISKKRQDFNGEGFNFVDKDGGENNIDIKPAKTKGISVKRKILDIGLQVGRPMKSF